MIYCDKNEDKKMYRLTEKQSNIWIIINKIAAKRVDINSLTRVPITCELHTRAVFAFFK